MMCHDMSYIAYSIDSSIAGYTKAGMHHPTCCILHVTNLWNWDKWTHASGPFLDATWQKVRRSLATPFSARNCRFPKILQGDNSFLIQKNLWRGRGRCLSRSPLINKIQAGFKLPQHSTRECQERQALDATSYVSEFCDVRTLSSLEESLGILFDPLSRVSIWI